MDYRYWDSNAFLGWLANEAGKASMCRPVIQQAEAGRLVIVTSALTIAEVLWLRGQPKIHADSAKRIEQFFRHSWIVVREVDRFIAEEARRLVWDKNVKPKDAIHLATALRRDVSYDQFDTFDDDLIKLSGKLGDPLLVIGKPNLPLPLPFEEEPESEETEGEKQQELPVTPSSPIVIEQPPAQSPAVEQQEAQPPEPAPPSTLPADQGQQRQDSSPPAPQPPPKEK